MTVARLTQHANDPHTLDFSFPKQTVIVVGVARHANEPIALPVADHEATDDDLVRYDSHPEVDPSLAARQSVQDRAVANQRGDFETAEKWLWKSLHIKEKHGDEIGVAASYHQLGVVAYTRQDLDAARKLYA